MKTKFLYHKMKQNIENIRSFGIDKECVEYARRWLYLHKGLIYQDVKVAADIWNNVSYYTRVSDRKKLPVLSLPNGSWKKPQPGDLLIYSEDYFCTGHVSVVVNIDNRSKSVQLQEQNFGNQYCAPYQQRNIHFIKLKEGYWLLDKYLLGWKSLR